MIVTAALIGLCVTVSAQQRPDSAQQKTDSTRRPVDTSIHPATDSLHYPLHDRRGDPFSNRSRNPFDLKDPANIRDSIEYDPVTKHYYIVEKIGNQYYRKPTYLTFDELMLLRSRQSENDYFRKRADALSALNKKLLRPKLSVGDNLFNRIFGNGKIDIRPQGNVDIMAGYQGQNIQNPTLPERARKTGGFDFNMNANLNVIGNIGDKLKLPISYNTLANFDFENQLKLDYTGGPDEIIKKIEAGNVSFTTPSTLMSGAQSLFGIKTKLQFGKLSVTAVLANQRSQKQTVSSQGGAAVTSYQFKADDYEENRHFLLAQYFRTNFNTAMSKLPIVTSQVNILRMEVWVTNRNGIDTGSRNIVGLMDLGESAPYNTNIHPLTGLPYPFNGANSEYGSLVSDPSSRIPSQAANKLNSLGLSQVQDFEMVYARKLSASDYYFNPQVGFISVNQTLQANDVLAVAYQYSYNGRIYQVGEFSSDVPPDTAAGTGSGSQKVLYLKLLKATSQRTNLPLWKLMMKNVYSLKTASGNYLSNIQQAGFQFNILYDEPSKGTKRYIPEGPKANIPLLTILNLDRLNTRNDPQPDGIFDYLEGYTVLSTQGRIIFPLLEPFGNDLEALAFNGAPQALKDKYIFHQLYDTIKAVAQTFANVDRYVLQGVAKGQASSNLQLGAYNVPPGSVVVTAGGLTLKENVDYVVDYNLGTVQVINQAILNSGVPVNVSFENNASFGLQQRSFMGVRFDYLAKNTATEALNFGATIERLSERPFFSKTNYGEDPIRNTMYGADVNYRGQLPQLTRALDKLPFYSTKEMSTVNAYGEMAILKPGHPPQIGKGSSGAVYVDDFEGSTSAIDLRYPLTSWSLASTPRGLNGQYPPLFPESNLKDSLDYGYNRAKLAWYNIEPTLQDKSNANNPVKYENAVLDPRIAPINVQQLFPEQTVQSGQAQLITFDLAYYPTERGPYNYDARPGSVLPSGKLLNPQKRWGGIMRAIDQTDFETNNIEVLQFWMQDPFLKDNTNSKGGQLYFDLGSVSEDILRDGKKEFENGLNTPNINAAIDNSSVWGRVPANPIQVTTAFSNDAADRPFQDVGLDGMSDDDEKTKFQNYLNTLAATYGAGSAAYLSAIADPSNDNFTNYRDAAYDKAQTGILGRYKNVNNPQGNSPIATSGQTTLTAYTMYPDQEDLNKDNTMNELEEYYEYRVQVSPDSLHNNVGKNFITDVRTFTPAGGAPQTWYQFRIPISEYYQKVGNIPDFKSIQFIRMYLTGFEDTAVVCRFAKLELVRNSWRSFNYVIDTTGNYTLLPTSNTVFNVTAVNIEQNSSRTPIAYVSPPGVRRQQELSNNNVNLLLNEQAMSLQICDLKQYDVRGVYKTTALDLRRYGTMDMFVHAEAAGTGYVLSDYDLSAVVRIGSDFVSNYYEIKIPLKKTLAGATLDTDVWPEVNDLNLSLQRLIQLKINRNSHGTSNLYYKETDANGKSYAILGNPNLGAVQAIFLGVQNVNNVSPVCTEVWFNELRLTDISQKGGWAAVGKVDIKLADLGTMNVSGSIRTAGFGAIDQSTNERSLDNNSQFDAATNLELGKLLPKKAAMSVPLYAGITKTTSTPQYDPFDLDIKLKDKVNGTPAAQKDSVKEQAVDQTTVTTVNLTNVHKNNTSGKPQKIWSVENFNVSYSYNRSEHHSPLAVEDELITNKATLAYNYTHTAKYWQPFRKIKARTPWLALIRDFNLNPVPSVLGFQANVVRQFGAYRSRNIGGPKDILPETYNKFFTFDRLYTLRWDLTRSLSVDFTATNRAWVDEDSGRLDKAARKRMWSNFWKGGRTILYMQSANATYTLPLSKIPALDWTTVRAGYSSTYTWTGASQLATYLGNSIQNTQQRTLLADLDFTRLYSKWKLLGRLDQAGAAQPKPPAAGKDTGRNKQPTFQRPVPELKGVARGLAKVLTSLKHITFNYSDNSSSAIYGFLDSTKVLGMNLRDNQPGWGYVFGARPDTNFINKLGRKRLLTQDTTFNNQNIITYSQRITATATLEPVRDLHVSITFDKTFGKNYSELYKDTSFGSGYSRLNPYMAGTFSISFISFNTLFEKYKPNELSSTFQKFENYRSVISQRLGSINKYTGGLVGSDGYALGYGKYAQDVLIPAFIAAYTGKSPSTIALLNESGGSNVTSNPFSGYLPKPNWSISYTGLSRIPGLNKIFTSFNITNTYTSTLSMNSFNSQLNYQDPLGYGQPGFIDSISGNFVPYYQVPNITISEQFAPLLDVDMQFVNQLQAKVGYSKSRQLSLSLIDFQLSETHSTEITIGAGIRRRGVPLPFKMKMPGAKAASNKLQNDLTLRLDFSIRDNATSSSYLDQNASLPTGGQRVVTISPSIDYVLNNRINLKLYFDERRTTPKISTTPPITTIKGGLQLRISLAP
ncbi:cell surface protein SprA [Flavitalea sp. BT771]|uniref:T9SS outer membrane translocon Sov/SprA n=1 Tax=Flavitalea sp. BT771 TaxID=3063329 RepID=UPI0026E21610|nr:cell surface protein SprA [Flavitalea sp. BT771]MDO6429710.1 cell surface protein SprA [Flavitalea sp. BT771]MDV6218162.1 cell surface protein SprA [Flavitalea sp. BT771]